MLNRPKLLWTGLLLAALFFPWSVSMAETIFLKNGQNIEGKIIQYTDDTISVETSKSPEPLVFQKNEVFLINFDDGSEEKLMEERKLKEASFVYLKNGEVILGMITQYNKDFVTIESVKGQGVLQLPTSEINMITSNSNRIDMTQRTAVGYHKSQSTLNSPNGPASYNSDRVSYKFYLDEKTFADMLVAFGSAKYGDNSLKVFNFEYRLGVLFKQVQNTLLYYGGSAGYLQVTDDANGISGSGVTFSGFVGAEMFFNSLPNFGFSGELGVGMKKAGEYSSTDLSTSSFPSFSIHYYF